MKTYLAPFAVALAVSVLPAAAQNEPDARATFVDTDGNQTGSAAIYASPTGVLISLDIEGLPADSWVSFHVHENGTCEPESAFESAGGHFNPDGAEHGYFVDGGPHPGDMPNQHVDANGRLLAHVFNGYARLDEGVAAIRGRALMIHDGQDDYRSQPSGDAGERVACAVVE